MIKVGEKLNSSIPRTREALERRDASAIIELAGRQLDAGADLLDVNASLFMGEETEILLWMMGIVQEETGARLMIDSPNPAVMAAALAADSTGDAVVNSVILDEARLSAVLPLVEQYSAGVVALPIGPAGIPKTPEARLENVRKLMERLAAEGIGPSRVYIDTLVEALSADSGAAVVTLETIRLVREAYPDVNILCGISNVSFGLPNRKNLNAAFLTGAILAGANAAIFDMTDPGMRDAATAAEALAGRDEYCMEYLRHCRGKNNP